MLKNLFTNSMKINKKKKKKTQSFFLYKKPTFEKLKVNNDHVQKKFQRILKSYFIFCEFVLENLKKTHKSNPVMIPEIYFNYKKHHVITMKRIFVIWSLHFFLNFLER